LFVDLYRAATDSLQIPPEYKQFELTMNDPTQARLAFEQIRAQDFGDELSIVGFLESAFTTIEDFEIPRFDKLYTYLVRGFIKKYNLRYRIDDPFRVRLVLPGVFANFYEDLTRVNGTDPHLKHLMNNFEMTFGSYARTKQAHELNACVSNAFIYAEGLAGKTSGENDTLGKDSELAATLAQGKPVIAFVPMLEHAEGFKKDAETLARSLYPELPFEQVVLDFLRRYYPYGAWSDPVVREWVATPSRMNTDAALTLLFEKARDVYDARARTLKESHPLGLQVNLATGVANGVFVVRKVDQCARLLERVVLNAMEFDIEEQPTERGVSFLLRERISGSVYRVMTGDELLTNSFWNFYL